VLVLSRQRDETIMIGNDVELTVVDIRGDKVRLGITAPFHIAVHRKEIYDAIKGENLEAARLSLPRSELSLSAPFNKGGTRPSIVSASAKLRNSPAVGRTAGRTGAHPRH